MRILFVSHYALPHLGGIEVVVDALARELAGRGHAVTHVAAAARRDDDPADAPRDLSYRRVLVPALNGLERRLEVPYPVFGPALLSTLRDELAGTDVLHAHGLLYEPAALALALARRRHPAVARVTTEHVGHVAYESRVLDGVQRGAFATIGRRSARNSQALVVLNERVRGPVAALAPQVPVHLIPNGVDTERYRPAPAEERAALRAGLGWDARPVVLFVGRLVAKKGAGLVLAAARELPDARFVLVGPGAPPEELPANAELLGSLAPEAVRDLYRAADAFLLPSRGEGFPVTAQEALASGLPVLLGHDPGYAAYLAGAGAAARMAELEPGAIVAALGELLAGDLRALGEKAAAFAREALSWAHGATAHEELYRGVATGAAGTRSASAGSGAGPSAS